MDNSSLNMIILSIVICYCLYQFFLWLIPFLETENEKRKALLLLKQRQQQRKLEPELDAIVNETTNKTYDNINVKTTLSKFKLTHNSSITDYQTNETSTNEIKSSTRPINKFTLKLPDTSNNTDNSIAIASKEIDSSSSSNSNSNSNSKTKKKHKKIFLDRVIPQENPWSHYNTVISVSELEVARNLIRQQDFEYEASLAIDRQRQINTNNKNDNNNDDDITKQFYSRRESLLESLPVEPKSDDDTISICFRFQINISDTSNAYISDSKANRLYRRFYKHDMIRQLVNFVESISTLPYYTNIEISTSYPKTIIYSNSNNDDINNDNRTLIDLGLGSNSIIWVCISDGK